MNKRPSPYIISIEKEYEKNMQTGMKFKIPYVFLTSLCLHTIFINLQYKRIHNLGNSGVGVCQYSCCI